MINVKSILALFLIISSVNYIKSQEGVPVYFDYLTENYYLVHPSMAGVNLVGGKIRMTARKQQRQLSNKSDASEASPKNTKLQGCYQDG